MHLRRWSTALLLLLSGLCPGPHPALAAGINAAPAQERPEAAPALADYVRKTPDRTISSWRDLSLVVVDRAANGCTLERVLLDLGFAADRVRVADASATELADADVLMWADGTMDSEHAGRCAGPVADFVRRGGICWILSQDPASWDPRCLPERLRDAAPVRQYGLRCGGRKAPHYVCPWLVQRHHAVFNDPHHLDESAFSFWNPEVNGEPCFTAALAALPRAPGWDVLGRYADPTHARGALIMQAPEGDGLYFWTQVFSPQLVWLSAEEQEPRRTWEKLLENVLSYFVSLRRGEVRSLESEPCPWSVRAGDEIVFQTRYESPLNFERATAEVRAPDGSRTLVELAPAGASLVRGRFTPTEGGEHAVRVDVRFRPAIAARDHFVFKVTRGWTMYRSIAHVHLRDCNGYGTQCPGAIAGAARRLGYDVVQLSSILDEGRWAEIRAADDPACRLIPGAEIHHRILDATGRVGRNGFEDLRAVGLPSFIPYAHRIQENAARRIVAGLIDQTHAQGGLAIGNPGAFWARQGLPLDGVEIDMGLGFAWGKPYRRYPWAPDAVPADKTEADPKLDAFWDAHRPLWIMGAVDCHGTITLLTRRSWNCVWLKDPLTTNNYLAALKAGRFAATSRIDRVWIDVAGQPMGGTVHVVDHAPIHIRLETGTPPRGIGTVRWPSPTPKLSPGIGDLEFNDQRYYRTDEQAYVIPPETPRTLRRVDLIRNGTVIRTLTPHTAAIEARWADRVTADSWYCVRAESSDGCAWSNPIFVKQISGPGGAWLWIDGKTHRVAHDREAQRWEIEPAGSVDVHFHLPDNNAILTIDGTAAASRSDPDTGGRTFTVPTAAKRVLISWRTACAPGDRR